MIYDAMTDFCYSVLSDMINSFGGFIDNVFTIIAAIDAALGISEILSYVRNVSIALVVVVAAKIALDTFVFQVSGDPDSDPMDLLTRVVETIAIIFCSDFICTETIVAAGLVSTQLSQTKMFNSAPSYSDSMNQYILAARAAEMTGVCIAALLVADGICMIIYCVQAAKRGAELELMRALMPMFALDMLTVNRERWKAFEWDLFSVAFGYIISMITMKMAVYVIAGATNDVSIYYPLACLGWLLVCIRAPKWLEKYRYTTGGGQMARGAGQAVASVRMIMR